MKHFIQLAIFGVLLMPTWIWADPCDSLQLSAQATGGTLTCSVPYVNLKANANYASVSYKWTGPSGFQSTQQFVNVIAPGTYQLVVTGPLGCTATAQTIVVNDCDPLSFLQPPACPNGELTPAETCASVCVTNCIDNYEGTTAGFQGDMPPPGYCSQIQNDQWIAFMATSNFVDLKAIPSNCADGNGIQMALYRNCLEDPIDCNAGCSGCGTTPITVSSNVLVPGNVYFILIDGYSQDQCDFLLEDIGNTLCSTDTSHCALPLLSGPATVCPGATVNYSVKPKSGCLISAYMWTAPPGALINGQPGPVVINGVDGETVAVTFPGFTFSDLPVCVRPITYFQPPQLPICLSVTSNKLAETILPSVTVCWEDLPYELPWGDYVNATGTYKHTYTSYLGCDSIVSIYVKANLPIIRNLGNRFLCIGETYTICGIEFSEPGSYSEVCESYLGCDSINNVNIFVLAPVAEIIGGGELTCGQPSIVLNSANSPSFPSASNKIWRNANGQVIGAGNSVTITSPGIYTLTTTMTAGGRSCSATDMIEVTANQVIPAAAITGGGTIVCNGAPVTIEATTNIFNPFFTWEGPSGAAFDPGANQEISIPGIYSVTVTNPENECSATATIEVTGNEDVPVVTINGGILTCLTPEITLMALSDPLEVEYLWTGPMGDLGSTPTITTMAPGQYTVLVTTSTGCTNTAIVQVEEDSALPEIVASQLPPACADTFIFLVATTNAPVFEWVGPEGIVVNSTEISTLIPGDYIFTATGTNGCTNTVLVTALTPPEQPVVTVNTGIIDCAHPVATLLALSNITGSTYFWTGPGGFTSDVQEITTHIPGNYQVTVTTNEGCSSTAETSVSGDNIPPIATISGSSVLSCDSTAIILTGNSTATLSLFVWSGPGLENFIGPILEVTLPGVYSLLVTAPNGCTSTAIQTISIVQEPEVILSQQPGTCGDSVMYLISNAASIGVIAWIGPNGFTSVLPNPVVAVEGTYTAIVTSAAGCTSVASISAVAPPEAPVLIVVGDSITCEDPIGNLSVESSVPGSTFTWSGPNNFNSNLSTPQTDTAGIYTVIVTTPDGCTAEGAAEVNGECVSGSKNIVDNSELRIYPIPSQGLIWLNLEGKWVGRDLEFKVFDSAGRFIWSDSRNQVTGRQVLDLQQLPGGVYQLLISDQAYSARRTVVLLK